MKKLNEVIKLNHEYKYYELCYLLDEPELEGNSKYAQFERWSKLFEYYTQGSTRARRFIVTKIYKQVPINTRYEVEGQIFNSRAEAEEYAKSL